MTAIQAEMWDHPASEMLQAFDWFLATNITGQNTVQISWQPDP
jgi:hypothetical protein